MFRIIVQVAYMPVHFGRRCTWNYRCGTAQNYGHGTTQFPDKTQGLNDTR